MELYGNSGLQDGQPHMSSNRHSPNLGGEQGSFGLKVQVQGIQGRPFVILNGQGKTSHPPVYPDVFLTDQQLQEHVSTMSGRGASIQNPLIDQGSKRQFQMPSPEFPESTKSLSSLLNYQRHPELLRAYDPRKDSLEGQGFTYHAKNTTASSFNQLSANTSPVFPSHITVKRARIPVPGTGREGSHDNFDSEEPASENVPSHPSHIICRMSVPDLGNDPRQSPQRMGRARHRKQVDPEERRRSQSTGASSSHESFRISPIPGRKASVQEVEEGEDTASASGRSSQNDTLANLRKEESIDKLDIRSLTAAHLEEQHNAWMKSPKSRRVTYRLERGKRIKPLQKNSDSSRGAQVTPDILKGQREILDLPNEDSAKLVLFRYLKEGSREGDDIIRQKVNLLFEKIQMLRLYAVENVEELSVSAVEVKELQDKKEELESQISQLKQQLEEEIKKRERLSVMSETSEEELRRLQDNFRRSEQEQVNLRQKLTDMEKELQDSLEKLLQMKREREQSRAEAKSLQQQLSDMHDELDSAKSKEQEDKETILKELANLRLEYQELQQVEEEQEEILHWKERELTALKGALEDEIAVHAKEMGTLQEQHKEEVQKLLKAAEEVKEGMTTLTHSKAEVEAERGASQAQVQELTVAKDLLLSQIRSLETQITTLNNIIQQAKSQENQLGERLDKLMEEKQRLEEELAEVRLQEEDLCGANRALTRHLEDTQSELTKLNHEHRQLKERLKEDTKQVEELRRSKKELEEERKKQDKAFEKLQEEMSEILLSAEKETQRLQDQVDEAKEQSLKGLSVLRTQLHSTQNELEKHTRTAQECQKELCELEAELARREGELEQAELKCKQLEERVEELQQSSRTTQDDRNRQVKHMEARVNQLQEALTDERSSGDSLMQRMEKVKEQVEQVRAELLQERAVRQDLECDKISLERQNKDLKSRVSYLESSQRSGQEGLVSKLELRVQELEERLLEEERESNTLQQANRKLERKMKEMTVQLNDEQLSLQNQRDQLTLRLKTLKRQLDEAEEEIERLEHSRKKLQRELDEQQETNEQLHSQLNTLRTELRRKKKPLLKSMDEDDEKDEEGILNSD